MWREVFGTPGSLFSIVWLAAVYTAALILISASLLAAGDIGAGQTINFAYRVF